MIKTVGLFELPGDLNGEDFWREHTLVHARELAKLGEDLLRGYIVSRIRAPIVGEPKFWGMVELWFENEDARAQFDARTIGTGVGIDGSHFEDYVRAFSAVEVEEHVIVPPCRDRA